MLHAGCGAFLLQRAFVEVQFARSSSVAAYLQTFLAIDFQAIRINVLMIEIANKHCRGDECQVRKDVRAKMAAEGYKQYKNVVHASDIYVHPESPFQVPESIAIPN